MGDERFSDGSRRLRPGQYRQPSSPVVQSLREENDALAARNAQLEHVMAAIYRTPGHLHAPDRLMATAKELKDGGSEWWACGELIERALFLATEDLSKP